MEREQEQVVTRLERRSDDSDGEPYKDRERARKRMRQTIDRARERSKGNETGKSRTIQGQGTVSGQSDSMEREQEQV